MVGKGTKGKGAIRDGARPPPRTEAEGGEDGGQSGPGDRRSVSRPRDSGHVIGHVWQW